MELLRCNGFRELRDGGQRQQADELDATVNGGVRVYFLGTNSRIYELFWSIEGETFATDITAPGSGATAAILKALGTIPDEYDDPRNTWPSRDL
jgi:hypothetical protein